MPVYFYSGSTNGLNNFYLGASMYHINRPKVGFQRQELAGGRISIHGGGSFPLSEQLTVHTSLIHQMQNKSSETIAGAALSVNLNPGEETSNNSIYIGSWVRFNDAVIPCRTRIRRPAHRHSYDFNLSLKAATASRRFRVLDHFLSSGRLNIKESLALNFNENYRKCAGWDFFPVS